MPTKRPKFSILLPVRNGEPYLQEALESVFAQTVEDFELIISNNMSSDGTAATLSKIRDPRVKIHQQNRSLSMVENWDYTLQQASGELALLLGSDDALLPDHLEHRALLHDQFPAFGLCSGDVHVMNEHGADAGMLREPANLQTTGNAAIESALLYNRFNIMSVSFRLDKVRQHRLHFQRRYRLFGDWRLWLDLLVRTEGFLYSPKATARYRVHSASSTSATRLMDWALESTVLARDFLIENRDLLEDRGMDLEMKHKIITENLWLIAQRELRDGRYAQASIAWELYRKHHRPLDFLGHLPSHLMLAISRRFGATK